MAERNSFNFDAYNSLIKNAPTGLKLHLGVQLIKDVVSSLEYFDNPLESELRPIYMDLKSFHTLYKERAKEAATKRENESERTASIDNRTNPTINNNDMMAIFAEFKRMLDANNQGTAIPQSAERSIRQIQDGTLHQQGDKTGTND